jgi:hypothetical protein
MVADVHVVVDSFEEMQMHDHQHTQIWRQRCFAIGDTILSTKALIMWPLQKVLQGSIL